MIITICGSMVFSKKMLETQQLLEDAGHTVYVSGTTKSYLGKTEHEAEHLAIKIKNESDAIKQHYKKIEKSDAILVLNFEKKGIDNYIGGNTFLEIGFAFVLEKKIYLLNPVPKISYYESEIKSMRPVILNNDLANIEKL